MYIVFLLIYLSIPTNTFLNPSHAKHEIAAIVPNLPPTPTYALSAAIKSIPVSRDINAISKRFNAFSMEIIPA